MAVPFGISIGDFIALGKLAHDIVVALKDTRGAVAEYKDLIELLESLVTFIQKVANFVNSLAACTTLRMDQALASGLMFHVKCCQRLLEKFLADSRSYTMSMINGKGSKMKSMARKLKWSLYKHEDVQKLEDRLKPHLTALQTYLITMNMQQHVEATNRQASDMHHISYSLSEIHTLVAITERNMPRALGYPWEADLASSHVHLKDILGRELVLPMALCRNMQRFFDTLKLLYVDHPGYQKVLDRDFEIIDQDDRTIFGGSIVDDDMQLVNSPPFYGVIRPGAHLEMNVLIIVTKEAQGDAMIMPITRHVQPRTCTTIYGTRDCLCYKQQVKVMLVRGQTPLQVACSATTGRPEVVVKMLIEHGADVNAVPAANRGSTALQAACSIGNEELVDILLEHNADVHVEATTGGSTALTAAIEGGNKNIIDRLLKMGADLNQQHLYALNALQTAVKTGNVELVDRVIQAGADMHGASATGALNVAVVRNQYGLVKRLLELGVEVNHTVEDGITSGAPIHRIRSSEMLQLLLTYGADINQPVSNPNGRADRQGADVHAPASGIGGLTALQAAASRANLAKVKILVEKHGADVNEPRSAEQGYTTLEAACYRIARFAPEDARKSDLELMDYLVDHGARITPVLLHVAAAWGHLPMVKLLLRKGARISDPPGYNDNRFSSPWSKTIFAQTAHGTARLNDMEDVVDFLKTQLES